MKKTLLIIGIIILVLIIGFAFIISSGNKENDNRRAVIDTVMTSLKSGDVDSVYAMTTPQFKLATSAQAFAKSIMDSGALYRLNEYQVTYVSAVDSLYSGILKDKNNKEHTFRMIFAKNDNRSSLESIEVDFPKTELKKEKTEVNSPSSAKIDEVRIDTKAIDFMASASIPRVQKSSDVLHIGVMVKKAGDSVVKMSLTYMPTGETFGPIEGVPSGWYYLLGRGSFKVVTYTITKPTNGWLPGNYRVTAALPSGETKTSDFTVAN